MNQVGRARKLATGDLVSLRPLTKSPCGSVVAPHACRYLNRGHLQMAAEVARCIFEGHFDVVVGHASHNEALLGRHFPEHLGQARAPLKVDRARELPTLVREPARAAGRDDAVNQLLSDGCVCLPCDRWILSVDLIQVLSTLRRETCPPARPVARNPHEPTSVQGRG